MGEYEGGNRTKIDVNDYEMPEHISKPLERVMDDLFDRFTAAQKIDSKEELVWRIKLND